MLITTNKLKELTKIDGGCFKVSNVNEAFKFCKKIAYGHYENFPVGSILISKRFKKHFFAIYAFARIADDISDELTRIETTQDAIYYLDKFNKCLEFIYSNEIENIKINNPIFLSLKQTIKIFNIEISPFKRLLEAFKSDILFKRFDNFDNLMYYCNNSANPIGELLLKIHNECTSTNLSLSNKICTGLQLINFWQDISIDLARNRSYIPKNIELKYNSKDNKEKLLNELYSYTKNLMLEGSNLLKNINNFRFKLELAFIIAGGNKIMSKIEKKGINIFNERPKIQKIDSFKIIINAIKLLYK